MTLDSLDLRSGTNWPNEAMRSSTARPAGFSLDRKMTLASVAKVIQTGPRRVVQPNLPHQGGLWHGPVQADRAQGFRLPLSGGSKAAQGQAPSHGAQ